MLKEKKISAIVCGMPFSGTTLLSRVITSHPLIEAGFECGLLFGNTPNDFKDAAPKFHEWMMSLDPPYNWKLTPSQLDDVCNSTTFEEAYSKIINHCHLFKGQKQFILDKTPAYIYQLSKVMEKIPKVPVILIEKELVFQYYSYKKRGQSLDEFTTRYTRAHRAKKKALQNPDFRQRVLIISFEELISTTAKNYRKVINHINKYNSTISFDKSQVPILNANLQNDIDSNQKKLRRKFEYQDELAALKRSLSQIEADQLKSLPI